MGPSSCHVALTASLQGYISRLHPDHHSLACLFKCNAFHSFVLGPVLLVSNTKVPSFDFTTYYTPRPLYCGHRRARKLWMISISPNSGTGTQVTKLNGHEREGAWRAWSCDVTEAWIGSVLLKEDCKMWASVKVRIE